MKFINYRLCWAFLFLLIQTFPLNAHESRPAHLEIINVGEGGIQVNWTRPVRNGLVLPLSVIFPEQCLSRGDNTYVELRTVLNESWKLDCGSDGLEGKEIRIKGLNLTISDVLLRYH